MLKCTQTDTQNTLRRHRKRSSEWLLRGRCVVGVELMPIVVGKPYANCAEDEKAFFRSEYHSAMSHVQSKALVDTRNATISKLLVEFLLPPIEKPRSENPPFLHIHVSKFDELLKPVKGVDPTDPQYARFSAWHADFDASNKLMCFQKRE